MEGSAIGLVSPSIQSLLDFSMTEPLTLKNIVLQFLNRIANPVFENRAIGTFLISGFAFLYFSQPLNINGRVQLDLGFLKADLTGRNDPNWYLFSLGMALIAYGGFALYKIKISPSVSRRSEIGELLLMIEQNKSSLRNAQIQQLFLDIFKIKPPVPIIEHLLAADDPIGQIYDYRYAGHFVLFSNRRFEPKQPLTNHKRQISFYSWAYYLVSFIVLVCIAAPLAPFIDAQTKADLSVIGFPIAIVFGLVAAVILNPIRAHSAALRLISSPCGKSPEKKKDGEVLIKLLSEIHTPTFDRFIHFGRMHIIYDDITHFWEGFNAIVCASNFHIHDPKLRDVINDLHKSWEKSLSFYAYFVSTNNASLHKFDSRHDIYRDENARAAYDAFGATIDIADKKLRDLLALVRDEFLEIDIEATNTIAMNDFSCYQITKI
ncbi:hypothetical protein [Aeromonas salmonicida]|uniref:hypothetical protein n=1 Tax=Aeromonas salmonicida TaxID=645 RepID=UPI0024A9DECA|nr:hypothetical protein [Aeromonas salmonicida]WHF41639.1 hypothetical protein QJ050_02350 [Aeromonas salmonicida]